MSETESPRHDPSRDNPAVSVMEHTPHSGGEAMFGFVKWAIDRHGERIMWGIGNVNVSLPEDEGYVLVVGERVESFDETRWELYDHDGHAIGRATGRVHHKMVPEFSPDIKARRVG